MGRGLDSDLLDALNVSEFTLNRLVEPRYRVAVQEQLWTIQKRARNGEDVLADLVALLDRHGELLRYIQFQRFMAPERRRRQQEARRRWEEELERIRRTGEQYQQLQQQQQQEQAAPGEGLYAEARLVNTLVVNAGGDRALSHAEWLQPGAIYEVLINVGHYVKGSLLAFKDAQWPSKALPDTGLWLRAVLSLPDERDPIIEPLYLPPDGDSFACDCQFGHAHYDSCLRQPWVRFTLTAPDGPTIIRAQIVLYYEVAAVHVQELTLPVGHHPGVNLDSRTVARLTTTFNHVNAMQGRAASLVVASATSRVLVNGLNFADLPFAIAATAADTSALNARNILYQTHFDVRNGHEVSRYDHQFSKTGSEFEHDLRQLAREGSALYLRIFASRGGDVHLARQLPTLLRHEASSRGRPPIIQVVDEQYDEHSMLWGIVYDLPLGGDPSRYELCESVRRFGPEGKEPNVSVCCPYEIDHRHKGNVLCPFGFWGLSCLIEQPPDAGRDLQAIVTRSSQQLCVNLAADNSLDARLAMRHITELEANPSRSTIARLPTTTEQELASALDPDNADVVYFYTHSGYEQRGGAVDRYLTLGDYFIQALNVNLWHMTMWKVSHWTRRPPLVVLNGCHTTETTSGTLNSFVTAFTRWAGASGVLGTEITLEQGLAGFVIEQVIAALARGNTVGEALREARWNLLRRGNLMGFAYTPYCLSTLAFRHTVTRTE